MRRRVRQRALTRRQQRAQRQHAGRQRETAHEAAGAVGHPADEHRADDLPAREDDGEGRDARRPRRRRQVVVDATTDRNTAPNSAPEANTATGCALATGSSVATASSASSTASGWPPR